MPQVSGTLVHGKPLIYVTVADALPAPQPVSPVTFPAQFQIHHYRALLDTGADITCLCDNVVHECGLKPTGFTRLVGGVGPSLHETFITRLGILYDNASDPGFSGESHGIFQMEPQEAVGIRANGWFDIIIGTDITSQYELRVAKDGFTFILD